MSDLFGNHIVSFPTRWLNYETKASSYMNSDARKPVFGISDNVLHKLGLSQKMTRIQNKVADQLCCNSIADLHFCFRICKNLLFFFMTWSFHVAPYKHGHGKLTFALVE